MATYEMHRLGEDRPHELSAECWCGPTTLSYGAEPVYDDAGNLIGVDESEDGD